MVLLALSNGDKEDNKEIKLTFFLFLFFLLLLLVGVDARAVVNAVVPPPGPGPQTRGCKTFADVSERFSSFAVGFADTDKDVGKVGGNV